MRQHIDGERPVVAADDGLRLQHLRPAPRAALRERLQRRRRRRGLREALAARPASPSDSSSLSADGRRRGRDAQQREAVLLVPASPDRRRPGRRPFPSGATRISRSRGDLPMFSVRVKIGPCRSAGRSRRPGISRIVGRRRRCTTRIDLVAVVVQPLVLRPGRAAAGRRACRRGPRRRGSSKRPVSGFGPAGADRVGEVAPCRRPAGWTWCWPLKLMPFQSMKPSPLQAAATRSVSWS